MNDTAEPTDEHAEYEHEMITLEPDKALFVRKIKVDGAYLGMAQTISGTEETAVIPSPALFVTVISTKMPDIKDPLADPVTHHYFMDPDHAIARGMAMVMAGLEAKQRGGPTPEMVEQLKAQTASAVHGD